MTNHLRIPENPAITLILKSAYVRHKAWLEAEINSFENDSKQ